MDNDQQPEKGQGPMWQPEKGPGPMWQVPPGEIHFLGDSPLDLVVKRMRHTLELLEVTAESDPMPVLAAIRADCDLVELLAQGGLFASVRYVTGLDPATWSPQSPRLCDRGAAKCTCPPGVAVPLEDCPRHGS